MITKTTALIAAMALGAIISASSARADDGSAFTIVIKDHKFSPAELTVPSGKKVKLTVDNQDPTAEEFESYELNREKVIGGNSKGVVFIGPLEPGKYKYFGEFNQDTAQGVIIVK